jgi:D-alanyl-lipoteichoic acid acyltransferase DltB (MBOAT superfamily)
MSEGSRSDQTYWEQLNADLEPARLLRLGAIALQFGLVVVAIRLTNLESGAFELLATMALLGFLVHHFLPLEQKRQFFAALSVASVPLVFGWEVGLWLLAMGGVLIALCHLPLPFRLRVALVIAVVLGYAAERAHMLPIALPPVPAAVWPILGSMFMFRLIVYLYDLKHRAAPFSAARSLSYFFMLPNACFPLFPVIDYKAFQRSFYNDDALRLYQTGVNWMARGLVHLALYKLVYFKGVIEPTEALDGLSAGRYMIATYLLYLKISGLFHLIVGLLHMYGFGLPETHHLYLFSSSFTDFWRRINIYWKDFIQKLVFNPAYFALRRLGDTPALCLATLIAFSATWMFHSYQWFWIRGDFPVVWSDLVFWLGLGVIVLVNVLIEARKGRRRSIEREARPLREAALHGMKVAGTFAAICVLWTVWSTPDVHELEQVWRGLLRSGPGDLAVLLGVPVLIGALGACFGGRKREVAASGAPALRKPFWPQAAAVCAVASAFIVVGMNPGVLLPLSPEAATLARDVTARRLNAADAKKFQRGYYEDLGDVARFNTELGILYGGWTREVANSPQSRQRTDAIAAEYIPGTVHAISGVVRTVNRHGMRDREYTIERPSTTFRIALVGSSHDAGLGVKDDETYENVVEERLNREVGPATGLRFEILNFSHDGYNPTQKLAVVEQKVFDFQPQLVLYVANSQELSWMFGSVQHLAKNGLLEKYPFVTGALQKARIDSAQGLPPKTVLESKLAPYAEDALRALLERLRDATVQRSARPVFVMLEIPDDAPWREPIFDRLGLLARSAGLPVLDLQGAYASVKDRTSLQVHAANTHGNARAHSLIADRLYALLLQERFVPSP